MSLVHPASGPSKAVMGAAQRAAPSQFVLRLGPTGRQRENDLEANRKERRHELESDDAAADASH